MICIDNFDSLRPKVAGWTKKNLFLCIYINYSSKRRQIDELF